MTAMSPEPDFRGMTPQPTADQSPAYPPSAYPPSAYPPSAYPPPAYPPPGQPLPEFPRHVSPPPIQPFPPPVYPPPDQYAPSRRPRAYSVVRIVCGALWAAFTIILAVGAVLEWLTGLPAASIMCLVFAVGCGWYDYRIWTFKARRLWF
jgi:hypothetical protein